MGGPARAPERAAASDALAGLLRGQAAEQALGPLLQGAQAAERVAEHVLWRSHLMRLACLFCAAHTLLCCIGARCFLY